MVPRGSKYTNIETVGPPSTIPTMVLGTWTLRESQCDDRMITRPRVRWHPAAFGVKLSTHLKPPKNWHLHVFLSEQGQLAQHSLKELCTHMCFGTSTPFYSGCLFCWLLVPELAGIFWIPLRGFTVQSLQASDHLIKPTPFAEAILGF